MRHSLLDSGLSLLCCSLTVDDSMMSTLIASGRQWCGYYFDLSIGRYLGGLNYHSTVDSMSSHACYCLTVDSMCSSYSGPRVHQ